MYQNHLTSLLRFANISILGAAYIFYSVKDWLFYLSLKEKTGTLLGFFSKRHNFLKNLRALWLAVEENVWVLDRLNQPNWTFAWLYYTLQYDYFKD